MSMSKKSIDLLFGNIAVDWCLLTEEQLKEVIRIQEEESKKGVEKRIAQICLEKKLLSENEVKKILAEQKFIRVNEEAKIYGSIAIKNRFVTIEQVKECLRYQTECYRMGKEIPRIGEILILKGYITPQQNLAILKAQMRLGKKVPGLSQQTEKNR